MSTIYTSAPGLTLNPTRAPTRTPTSSPTTFPTPIPTFKPTTLSPTTLSPTTLSPTTLSPTTLSPTTSPSMSPTSRRTPLLEQSSFIGGISVATVLFSALIGLFLYRRHKNRTQSLGIEYLDGRGGAESYSSKRPSGISVTQDYLPRRNPLSVFFGRASVGLSSERSENVPAGGGNTFLLFPRPRIGANSLLRPAHGGTSSTAQQGNGGAFLPRHGSLLRILRASFAREAQPQHRTQNQSELDSESRASSNYSQPESRTQVPRYSDLSV